MNNLSNFIQYKGRKDVVNELEEIINLYNNIETRNNRLNRLIVGLPSIGKSYLLRNIALFTGLNCPNLFVAYFDCRRVDNIPVYCFL